METPQPKDRSLLYIGIGLSIIVLIMGYLSFFVDDPSKMFSNQKTTSNPSQDEKKAIKPLKKSSEMSDEDVKKWLIKFIDAFYYDQNRGYFDPPSYFANITQTFYNYHNLTLGSVLEIHNKRLMDMRHLEQRWVPSSLEYVREGSLLVTTYDLRMSYFKPSTGKQETARVEIGISINEEGKIISFRELQKDITSSIDAVAPYDSLQHRRLPSAINKLYDVNTVSTPPEFIGDVNALTHYIETTLKYPNEAKENDIQGKVYLGFIVEKDGSLSNVEIINGIGNGCDEEAIRVLRSSPPWKPGTFKGMPVRTALTLAITFQLSDK